MCSSFVRLVAKQLALHYAVYMRHEYKIPMNFHSPGAVKWNIRATTQVFTRGLEGIETSLSLARQITAVKTLLRANLNKVTRGFTSRVGQ